MDFNTFSISRLPRILFGAGRIRELPEIAATIGCRALIVTGQASFRATPRWPELTEALEKAAVHWQAVTVSGEPSPELIDNFVAQHASDKIELVIAIGGGSVLDAAKAIAGLLPYGNSVMDHLEGVGHGKAYHGPALPFIAVPTTAGTGSEATKNAVLSRQGIDGFKKSFRHETLIPEYAIIDPDLLSGCPQELIAADGMDAFTQLLESYVSIKANPMIDALAWSGLEAFKEGFFDAWRGEGAQAINGHAAMAYAALISGITLSQVGLGSVHGLASPLGAFFPIPHGVVCGTLVSDATAINIRAMQQREVDNPALAKYARVGRFLCGRHHIDEDTALDALVDMLTDWTRLLKLPPLSAYGVSAGDLPRIVANSRGSSMTTNPIVLADDEILEILTRRL